MTLNVKTQKDGDLRCLNGQFTTTLNAKLKKDDDIECLNEYEKWLRKPKLRKMVTQNIGMGMKNDSERQGWRKNADGYGCGYETTAPN